MFKLKHSTGKNVGVTGASCHKSYSISLLHKCVSFLAVILCVGFSYILKVVLCVLIVYNVLIVITA